METNEQLVARFHAGDRTALDQLMTQNLGMVMQLAGQQSPSRGAVDDAMQEAYIALVRAAELFNPTLGIKFSTYAYNSMRNRLTRWSYSQRLIHFPHSAAKSGATRPKCYRWPDVSSMTFVEDHRQDGEAWLEWKDERRAMRELMKQRIPPRWRWILKQRFKGRTLEAIGKDLHLSKERIRQICNEAKERLTSGAA
jgi:RNA polymerase sigma factor (sigma-70 family)